MILRTTSPFAKAFNEILDFNNSKSDYMSENKLRVFLEEYLNIVFSKQIQENNLSKLQFGVKIDRLAELGVISQSVHKKLHEYRTECNSGSHVFQSSTIEDDRNFSIDMIDYLFSKVKLQ